LRALGADGIELPVIALEPPPIPQGSTELSNLATYDWLFSPAPTAFDSSWTGWINRRMICARSKHASAPSDRRRRKAVEELHLKVDLMPAEYIAESLVQAFASEHLAANASCCHARRGP